MIRGNIKDIEAYLQHLLADLDRRIEHWIARHIVIGGDYRLLIEDSHIGRFYKRSDILIGV